MARYHRRHAGRRNPRGRSSTSKSAILYKKPTATTQQRQIASLAAKVNRNSRQIRAQRYLVQHQIQFEEQGLTRPAGYAPYNAWSLNNIAFMQQIFGDPAEALGGKYTGKKMRLDFNIDIGKSTRVTNFTAFIVRPKTQKVVNEIGIAQNNTLSPTGPNPNPLLDGTDYSYEAGLALMNPKRYHIDKVMKLQIRPQIAQIYSGTPPAPVNYVTQDNRVRRTVTLKNPMYINSRTGDWKTTTEPWELPARMRSFLVIFDDTPAVATPPGPGPTFEGLVHLTAHTSE